MNKSLYKAFSLLTVLAMLLMALPLQPAQAAGSISLVAFGVNYTQDFNTLSSTVTSNVVPLGWDFVESGTGTLANGLYGVGTGSGNSGDTYSLGAAGNAERAFGGLRSGSVIPLIGAQFSNATGGIITQLSIAYTGEQWRLGSNTAGRLPDRLDFQFSTDATSLSTGTWTDVNELDFSSPVLAGTVGLLNGNVSPNRTAINFLLTGLQLSPNATFWLRWFDFDVPSSDDALAIDDFSLVPFGVEVDAAPYVMSTTPGGNATDVTLTSNLAVSFSEPVSLSGDWFQLACPVSGVRGPADAVVSDGPTNYTIDLNADLANSETCNLTVFAAQVADVDANDPPDFMAANYLTSFTTFGPDNAPAVVSTIPADGAVNVPLNQNITVNFSEPVTVTEPWYSLTCQISHEHPAVVTGGPTTFVLNPTADFVYGEQCTLLIDRTRVADLDNNDPPDTLAFNFTAGFNTELDPCTLPFTPAYQIQGTGLTAAVTGAVTTQGVVVGDYEGPSPTLRGFYLQDPTGDNNPATSDGIFIFNNNNNNVALGDVVRVTGNAGENQGQTQVTSASVRKCGTGSVSPVDVTFPVASDTYLERYEGMLVRLPQTLSVTEMFQLGRFGQVVLSANGRLHQPTNVVAPGAAAQALQAQNNLNKIILDDASQVQNPDPIVFGRNGSPLSAANTLRGGDTATNIVGIMTYTWAGNAASGNAYRVRPINALNGAVNFEGSNARPETAPEVGGNVKVVGMNLLNFFNTFADSNAATPGCFPSGLDSDCRGANSAAEFVRQYTKTVAAIVAMNPDVVGVNEIENDGYGPDSSLQFLVDQLNLATAPGTYAFIDVDAATGQVNSMGTDAIRIAMLYKPAVVTPVGKTSPLNTDAFVNGGDASPRNRATLAQAFQVNSNGGVFIVDANHLKSKGSACTAPDAGDGQGNCNQVRANAMTELVNWFATDPTGTGDPDILLVGDYNSYAKEDPITVLKNAGFTDLIESFLGPDAYSYVFDGQWGYLDQALASASLTAQVTGVGDYHINSDEPSVLDFNVEFKTAGQIASLYAPDQFRVSDHDPVVVGLHVNAPPSVTAGGPYSVAEGASVLVTATGTDPDQDALSYAWDLDLDGIFETAGQSVNVSAAGLDGPTSFTIRVRVTDPGNLSAVASAEVTVTNVAPSVSAAFASNSIACGVNNATLNVSFTDPGTPDTHTAVIDWGDGSNQTVNPATSPFSLGHTYAAAGKYTATVTVTDDDGGANLTTALTMVKFNTTGFQPPINGDGSDVFKSKSTIPVKIGFTDCNGSAPANLAPTIQLTVLSGPLAGQVITRPVSTSAADSTGVMRLTGNHYLYNLAARDLPDPSASYLITVTLPYNGQTTTVKFGLRP